MGALGSLLRRHRAAVLLAVVMVALVAVVVQLHSGVLQGGPAPVGARPSLPRVNGTTTELTTLAPDGSPLRFGQTGESTCSNPAPHQAGVPAETPATRQEWRVSWQVAGSAGAATEVGRATMVATRFDVRIGDGTWLDQSARTWALRWTPTLRESLTAASGETFDRRGTPAVLKQTPVRVDQSPRYVTPDGACTVYLIPFGVGPSMAPGQKPARTVGVVGDSLMAQLSAPDGDTLAGPGALYARFRDVRLGVDAQAGRLWTPTPDPYPVLDVANGYMLDEIRGMSGADVLVIALGANDAGFVARAPAGQAETRLAWVLLHLAPIIDELDATSATSGRCVVLLTMGDRQTRYLDSTEAAYADAATRINDYLRQRVRAAKGQLRLSDWAQASASHHVSDPDSWYGPDTLHLSTAGRAAYADQIAAAPDLCPPQS